MIQVTIGTLFFIIIGFFNGWLITDDCGHNLIVIIGQLITAVAYLIIDYLYNVKMVAKINEALKK